MTEIESAKQVRNKEFDNQQDGSETPKALIDLSDRASVAPDFRRSQSDMPALEIVSSRTLELSVATASQLSEKPLVPILISTYYPKDSDPINSKAGASEEEWTARQTAALDKVAEENGDKVRVFKLSLQDPLVQELEMPSSPATLVLELDKDGKAIKKPALAVGELTQEDLEKLIDRFNK